jgi:actin-related protein
MFEVYDKPACYIINESELNSYFYEKENCIILDLGYDSSKCIEINNGKTNFQNIKFESFGGSNMDKIIHNSIFFLK